MQHKREARSGASLIRDRSKDGVRNGPGSAAHHFVLRCARDTSVYFFFSDSASSATVSGDWVSASLTIASTVSP